MKQKLCNLIKYEWRFKLFHFGIMIATILIATTLFRYDYYALQLPGNNVFANVTYTVVIIMAIIFYYVLTRFKNIKIERLYLLIVIPVGIMYCIANPLGKIPDEDQHARKAYMVSKGVFFAEKNEEGEAIGMIDSKLPSIANRKTSSYEEYWNKLNESNPNGEKLMKYSMATYAPICHIPQALGMIVTRLFGANIVVQCYAGRICNFFTTITLIYFAIKLIPFKKKVVMFLGLLPIIISQCASLSSDALTLGSCIFFISYILYLKYDSNKKMIDKKDIGILLITSIVISLCKIVYVPLCILLFTLPKDKFKSNKVDKIAKIGIFIIAFVINIVWLIYASTFLNEVNPGVNSGEQVKYIVTHPISYCLILFRTAHIYNQTFIMSLCGEGLGHFNSQASVLFTFPCLILFTAMFIVDDDKQNRVEFTIIERIVYTLIFIIIVLLVYTSLYVAWTPVRSSIILGVQSRYFLPVILLTAIVLDNKKIVLKEPIKEKYILSFMLFLNLNALSNLTFMYIYNYVIEYYLK